VEPRYASELDPVTLLTQVQPDNNTTTPLPADLEEQLKKIKQVSKDLRSAYNDISGGVEQLRGAVKVMSSRMIDIDNQGRNFVCPAHKLIC
jgi:hypothetical protein